MFKWIRSTISTLSIFEKFRKPSKVLDMTIFEPDNWLERFDVKKFLAGPSYRRVGYFTEHVRLELNRRPKRVGPQLSDRLTDVMQELLAHIGSNSSLRDYRTACDEYFIITSAIEFWDGDGEDLKNVVQTADSLLERIILNYQLNTLTIPVVKMCIKCGKDAVNSERLLSRLNITQKAFLLQRVCALTSFVYDENWKMTAESSDRLSQDFQDMIIKLLYSTLIGQPSHMIDARLKELSTGLDIVNEDKVQSKPDIAVLPIRHRLPVRFRKLTRYRDHYPS